MRKSGWTSEAPGSHRTGPPRTVIPRLGNNPGAPFPPQAEALEEPDGLLAWGGDLSPPRLLNAYAQGIFPWYSEDDPILWWCPEQRCIMHTDSVYVSRRLGRQLGQCAWRVTADLAFTQVVSACATSRTSTWIMPEMIEAYGVLHELGHAHSIEVWDKEELIGGLYGVALGHMFFGESMYSAQSNASKVVLVELCRVLQHWGFSWMDCQVPNPHLFRMGAQRIKRDQFLDGVDSRVGKQRAAGSWTREFAQSLDTLGTWSRTG